LRPKNYIGLANTFHDSAIAVVNAEGDVVFAEATERYLQYKRALSVPPDLPDRVAEVIAEYCDPEAELIVAFPWSIRGAHVAQVLARTGESATASENAPDADARSNALRSYMHAAQWKALTMPGQGVRAALMDLHDRRYREPQFRHFDHHLAHAATACFTSPFSSATCAILDGFGEGRAFASFDYRDGKLTELETPHRFGAASLGVFFNRISRACGFGTFSGEEWKVMGLAPYAKPDEELCAVLRATLPIDGIGFKTPDEPTMMRAQAALQSRMRRSSEPTIDASTLAASGQHVFTEVMLAHLRNVRSAAASSNLTLGGGCALNSACNGKILDATGLDALHVFAAPADDGNAIGAALLAHRQDRPQAGSADEALTPYLGSTLCKGSIQSVVRFGRHSRLRDCGDSAPEVAAHLLAEGKIIGWIQGRAEFGPRALGNRSILADPRDPSMKDAINGRIKFREEFRPFAPSILHEYGHEYFENYQESPYMERALVFRQEVRARVPAVVHVDGTGRLQSVRREWNEAYFQLIDAFRIRTGVPLVLNTSFNVMGKPIAHTVEDVLAVFYTTGLDAVFLDRYLIEK
jgi:carbamoyltransferase